MARVTDFLPTPSEIELANMRGAVLDLARRNGHQVDALELACSLDQMAGAVCFAIAWREADDIERAARIWIGEVAITGRYAREAFLGKVASIFPPPPPLPPVFLDAGAGI